MFQYIFNYENYDNTVIKCFNHIGNYNIIFIKIFQWIWIKNNNQETNNYLTETISKELYNYTNNTPYNESDIDYKNLTSIFMIAHERGDKLELLDIIPCNSGTISLIFKAKLNKKRLRITSIKQENLDLLKKNLKSLFNIKPNKRHADFSPEFILPELLFNLFIISSCFILLKLGVCV